MPIIGRYDGMHSIQVQTSIQQSQSIKATPEQFRQLSYLNVIYRKIDIGIAVSEDHNKEIRALLLPEIQK